MHTSTEGRRLVSRKLFVHICRAKDKHRGQADFLGNGFCSPAPCTRTSPRLRPGRAAGPRSIEVRPSFIQVDCVLPLYIGISPCISPRSRIRTMCPFSIILPKSARLCVTRNRTRSARSYNIIYCWFSKAYLYTSEPVCGQ